MTSITLTARLGRRSALGRSVLADVGIAGGLLFGAGAIALLGIITAEALYPALYTTAGNEISDLGGTRPPGGLVYQPSATIFNATMLVTGLMTLMGAVVTHGAFRRWLVTLPIAVLGGAVVGVALFPGNTGAPHAVLAMVAFISGGVAAVLSTAIVAGPLRFALGALGLVNLVLLGSYFTQGDASPLWVLGVGGAERWVAYPVLLWLMGFGGYLAGRAEAQIDIGAR